MKTPKQLRSDIQALTAHLSQVQEGLLRRADIKVARIGKECKRTADALGVLLNNQSVPDEYKVAVVGRFKAGKSFFVNELLGNKLASEGVFAETAAITTFRHGPEVKANIRLVEVRDFYREIKTMLKDALRTHLTDRSQSFGEFLLEEARGAPRDALNDVQLLLEQAADNIVAATTEHLAELNESAESLIGVIDAEVQVTLQIARQLQPLADAPKLPALAGAQLQPAVLADHAKSINCEIPLPKSPAVSPQESMSVVDTTHWCSQIQQNATVMVDRLQLKEGTAGWPYEKLFEPRLLAGALRLSLVDPRLSNPHQLRNLQELLLHVAETARPKEIEVVTNFAADESPGVQTRVIKEITNDLFKNYGVALNVRFASGLHDRWLALDNGVLFKLGRGLDVYKPALGLATHRPALRRVRATEIDVFVLPGHPLAQQVQM